MISRAGTLRPRQLCTAQSCAPACNPAAADSIAGRPDKEQALPLEKAVTKGKRHPRQVKDELAQAIVARFHSPETAQAASAEFERVFSEHKQPDEIPTVVIPMTQRKNGKLGVIALLVTAGLAESNGAARRLIQQGAVKIGETKITDIATELDIPEGCVIQAGKRGFARIVSA